MHMQGSDVLAVRRILEHLDLESKLEPKKDRLVNRMKCYFVLKQLINQMLNSKAKEDVNELR